jgi:hypothetical protein
LREPPPSGVAPGVSENGCLVDTGDNFNCAFDEWLMNGACEHEDGVLMHHRLGNINLIADLREEIAKFTDDYPLILDAVIYSGTHSGDWIAPTVLPQLAGEVDLLLDFKCSDPDMEPFIRHFANQMRELVECALRVGKPIAF